MRTVIHLNDYMSTHLSSSSSSSSSSSKIIQAFLTSTPRTTTTKTPLHADNAKQQRTQKIKLFLSSAISEQTGCGLSENPWVLMAGPGQRINITVIDFSQESLQLPEPMDNKRVYSSQNPTYKQMDKSRNRTSEFTCRVLANIRESSFDGISTVCSGQGKVVNVKTSTSNKVELRFHGNRVLSDGSGSGSVGAGGIAKPAVRLHSHFLFQIEVLGCATPTYPAPMTAKRIGDLLMVECNKGGASSGGTGWTLTCINDVWIGNHGNCSHASSTISEKLENLFPYATSVVTIGVIAVFMIYARRYTKKISHSI
ncbi:hypothetical protein HELRODRAFT_180474 [Helobdella robusta]|uniref:Uncharacterized protein n=1 Tax=Helobdella robusta TaxID=6412 RepID=T1FFZ2_HELRO|nr:hypothetical protein HELRODRAFT_180474 [Helobdella robusta]ESN93824.1 hypothetical protein HELRODRAFT_180474 [Helobdella robusta]